MSREVRNKDIIVRFIPPIHWWQRANWELLVPYISHSGTTVVPAGFVTDGASVPVMWRWRFSPTGQYFGAAIVHDYLLVQTGSWEVANKEFDAELKALKVSNFERIVLMASVRFWAKVRKWFKK